MGPAVIVIDFDPKLHIAGAVVHLQTLALALVILVSILLTARLAVVERRRASLPGVPFPISELADLRLDDLLFLILGAVPGAVIGGRLGAVLANLDYFRAAPSAILDPGIGSLSLALGVVGGLLSAAYVGRLLGAPLGGWAHVVALPLLFALAAGKVALALGGSGQGLPSDASWAMAYPGPGPWGSLGPEVPSHPAQLYEAATTAAALVLVGLVVALGGFRQRTGAALLTALSLWATGRAIVADYWRDPAIVGTLRVEQLVAIAIALGSAVALVVLVLAPRRRSASPGRRGAAADLTPLPEWPDPETRPRF